MTINIYKVKFNIGAKAGNDGLYVDTVIQNMIAGVASAAVGSFEEVYKNLAGKAISGTITASSGNGLGLKDALD